MGSRHIDYPSPRGVHVPETFYSTDPDDPYRRPSSRRNRYSRSVQQTPRRRDVTWISSPPDSTAHALHVAQSPWRPPPPMPSSPTHRPPGTIPPSPAPTVGERMTLDEIVDVVEPYPRPQRPGLIKSFWKGLKKLSGFESRPSFPIPWRTSYESQTAEVPAPVMSAPSEGTQYVNPTSSGTETERRSSTPYTSPYLQPTTLNVGGTPALRGSTPYTSPYMQPTTLNVGGTPALRGSTPYTSPYLQPANLNVGGTSAAIPASLRASPVPIPSPEGPPPITIISPSISPSPRAASIRSVRMATPGPMGRKLSAGGLDLAIATEEGSQTLHEPVYFEPASQPVIAAPIPIVPAQNLQFALGVSGGMQSSAVDHSLSNGSLTSTMARIRRFVTDLDGLPWVSGSQIANEYIPEMNPRSRLRKRVRQGADPSWYNRRPEVVERQDYWSQWDMWAKQSTAMWNVGGAARVGWAGVGAVGGPGQGQPGQWGAMYPHGYTTTQQPYTFPSGYPAPVLVNDDQGPVIPS